MVLFLCKINSMGLFVVVTNIANLLVTISLFIIVSEVRLVATREGIVLHNDHIRPEHQNLSIIRYE